MKQLRTSIIVLLFFVGITLNIERFDFGSEIDVINIQSFFYVLYGVAILSTLIITPLRRVSISVQLVGWIGIYLICKLIIFSERPFVGGVYTFLSITEITLLSIGILLTGRINDDLASLENVLANINLTDVSSRVMEFEKANDDIAREFIRSRRYDLPLSVVTVRLDAVSVDATSNKPMEEIMRSLMTKYTTNSFVRVLDKALRRTDIIIEHPEHNRIILLFPETNADGSKTMVTRIGQLAHDHIGIPVSCGYATFPDEALTFEELIEQAEEHYKHQSTHLANMVADKVDQVSSQCVGKGVE